MPVAPGRIRLCRFLGGNVRPANESFCNAHYLRAVNPDSVAGNTHRAPEKSCPDTARFAGSHHPENVHWCRYGYSSHSLGLQMMHRDVSARFQTDRMKNGYTGVAGDRTTLAVAKQQRRLIYGGPVLWSLIAANVGVSAMWYRVNTRFMDKHFMISAANILALRWHVFLTSAFSHIRLEHLLWNMMGLFCFGRIIEQLYGGTVLLSLYVSCALMGSAGHLFYILRIYPWLKNIPYKSYDWVRTPGALGASGAVTGLAILFILKFPTHTIFVMFFPMPAAIAGCIIIGRDLYLAVKGDSDISVGAHLGGASMGLFAYALLQLGFL